MQRCAAAHAQEGGVAAWFGYVRCDGHGTCTLKKSDEHIDSAPGAWEVIGPSTVRIRLNPRPGLPLTILMHESEADDTVVMRAETWSSARSADEPACFYSFVPEDDGHGH